MKKTILLPLMASSLLAENDGVFMSVGYQIGEAVQMVKNTGEIQKVSNAYENLNNLLTRYNELKQTASNTDSSTAQAIDNLKESASRLKTTPNSANQAVSSALSSAVGMWQVVASNLANNSLPTSEYNQINAISQLLQNTLENKNNDLKIENDYDQLLTQASTIISTLQSQCPGIDGGNGKPWGINASGNACNIFGNTFNAINSMINSAKKAAAQARRTNPESPNQQNAFTNADFNKNLNQVSSVINDTISYLKGDNLATIYNTLQKTPDSKGFQSLVSRSSYSYSINETQYSQFQTTTKEFGHNPFRSVGLINSQSNNGAMNGVGVQLGYKQFFGKNKFFGIRYYAFFDYNHAYIKSNFFNSASNVFTYGAGSDLLLNFINGGSDKNRKVSFGIFGGIALAGTTWLNSQLVNLKTTTSIYNAKINNTNFQFLFNTGLRLQGIHHGVELGVKIPTINTNYYSFMGAKLAYRRLYSVYFNYVLAY
ncbi:Hop family outer membrane protein HopA [Helicobacter pylori]|uniref:Hop family outer membrane protein HopA n=1 Tax=Helicobacter pylori TaxID=210 RepID=UPI00026A025C|nr:Hop family outer membrane protein HopA [Helicobacter pylori]EJB52367.1 outer membrane protein HopA [Helicobacter pylori Hp H-27]WQV21930.1 Hop family outer membrane protein HopA [Helicobacter pylori]WQV66968.1 Hop family outer membrane protein HopA [Helicobacter pylori]WQV94502.1 Hop family outer membrane protein HopA [Helicobacter pylori]WQV95938.1 Hop family outer membrane protein HopA [Helicobacter pylori]